MPSPTCASRRPPGLPPAAGAVVDGRGHLGRLCGSDLHWYAEGGTGEVTLDRPVVPGHEFAGVALDGPHAGRRVAVDPAIPCGRCELPGGYGNLCPRVRFAGHAGSTAACRSGWSGPTSCCSPLPDASATTLAHCSSRSASRSTRSGPRPSVRLGHDVLVVGGGPIGVLAPAAPVGPAPRGSSSPSRWSTAGGPPSLRCRRRLVAGAAPRSSDAGGHLRDGVSTPSSRWRAPTRPRHGGRLRAAGGADRARGDPVDSPLGVPAAPARRKGLTFAMVRRMHDTYPRAIHLASEGIDLDRLVTAGSRSRRRRGVRARRRPDRRPDGHHRHAIRSATHAVNRGHVAMSWARQWRACNVISRDRAISPIRLSSSATCASRTWCAPRLAVEEDADLVERHPGRPVPHHDTRSGPRRPRRTCSCRRCPGPGSSSPTDSQ